MSLKVVVNEGSKESELNVTGGKKVEDREYIAVESLEKPSPAENSNIFSEQFNLAKDVCRLTVTSDN